MLIFHNVENFNISGLDPIISLENCRRTFSVKCNTSGLILPKVWPTCIPATHCVGQYNINYQYIKKSEQIWTQSSCIEISKPKKIETTSNKSQKKVQLDCLALKSCFTHQCRGGTLPFSPLCLTLASGWNIVIVTVIVIVIVNVIVIVIVIVILIVIDRHWYLHSTF